MSKQCKSCGGNLVESSYGKYSCPWCGHEYTQDDLIGENEKNSDLETFSLLNNARLAIEVDYDFQKSLKFSQSVLEKNPASQEANWLAMLATNQIIYIQNEKGKYTPTYLEPEKSSLKESSYYLALNPQYRAKADEVESIRLQAVEEYRKVKPYDVFLSYKQHDGSGAETKEAVWARDIYTELKTNSDTKHLNVFFDQKCLTGSNVGWEPHIYAAIRSAKCMIILGSSLDNINSRWVKNEWKRFLSLKNRGDKKREFVVLGSEAVNPVLLDEALQEKQMILNTSGNWLNTICGRVTEICKKLKPEKEVAPAPPQRPKKKRNKKAIIGVCAVLAVCLAGGGLGGGLYYMSAMSSVNETIELIDVLPSSIIDFEPYEDAIAAAQEKFDSLAGWQQEKVTNRDRLDGMTEGFNTYRLTRIRELMSGVSADTVETSTALQDTAAYFKKFNSQQRSMLTGEELNVLNNYVKAADVISSINAIKDDLINKQGEVDGVKTAYLSIAPEYQNLVYNYPLVATFIEQAAFLNRFAFAEVSGGYSISLKAGETLSGAVSLPETYNGKNVVEIGESAFENCREITSLTVPDTVKTIGVGAFKGCDKIADITLPFIGKSAEVLDDENGYQSVFGYIFGYEKTETDDRVGATAQTYFNPDSSETTASRGQYAYCRSIFSSNHYVSFYKYFIPNSIKSVTVTQQTRIPTAAFNRCEAITSITYEQPVTEYAKYAFQNCTTLVKFNAETNGAAIIKAGAEDIGTRAFGGCKQLTSLSLPESLRTIGEEAFTDLSITSLTIPDGVRTVEKGAFTGCNKLVDITLPFTGRNEAAAEEKNGYSAVFGFIFGYEQTDTSDYIGATAETFFNPDSREDTTSRGQYAYCRSIFSSNHYVSFYKYLVPTSLRTVTVTKQTAVPTAAFNRMDRLTEITFEKPLTEIGQCAFQNCSNLVKLNAETAGTATLKEGLETIGANAFSGCKQLAQISLPESLRTIGEEAFAGCIAIEEFTIPVGVREVGKGALMGCSSLVDITLPFVGRIETVSEAKNGHEAVFGFIFGYKQTDTSDNIGATAQTFYNPDKREDTATRGEYGYCTSIFSSNHYVSFYHYFVPTTLRTVTVTKQTAVPTAAFNRLDRLTEITYLNPLTAIGQCAFQNMEQLKRLNSDEDGVANIVGTYDEIGANAFSGCKAISSFNLSDTVRTIGDEAFSNCTGVVEFTVPDSVRTMGCGTFKGCTSLENLTLPFIGKNETAINEKNGFEAVFGYIFGYEQTNTSDNIGATAQTFYNPDSRESTKTRGEYGYCTSIFSSNHYVSFYHYFVPTSLRTVTVTRQTQVPVLAYNRLEMLTLIVYKNEITSRGEYAFQHCVQPTIETEEEE